MQSRLAEAIQLREEGRAKQDESILGQARTRLLDLDTEFANNAEILFQLGVCHDNMGLEQESISYYVRAISLGLSGASLERCLLGLGSTYRGLGRYEEAEATLRRGVSEFPDNRALQIFLSMTLYNAGKHREALEIALTNLMETTTDEKLLYYKRGITYYSQHLDEVWT